MLRKITRLASCPNLVTGFLRREISSILKDDMVKLTELLKAKYLPHNDEIPPSNSVRLIDDETNQFIGIFSTEKA
jgi:hypothetical protein